MLSRRPLHWTLLIGHWSLAIALMAAPAFAQTTAPAGPDRSSPKVALTSLYTALRAGDFAAASACMHFKDPQQAEIFALSFSQTYTPLRLMNAMTAKFGDAGAKPFANATLLRTIDANLERLQRTEFALDNDTATVDQKKAAINPSAENELTGITLKRENGHWLVVASTFSDAASDLPPQQVERLRPLHQAVEAAVNATIPRIAAGSYKTPAEAYSAYQTLLQQAAQGGKAQ